MKRKASSGEHPELTSLHLFEQQAAARDFYDEFVNREEGEGLAQSDSKPLIQLQIHTTERPQPLREMTSDKVRRQNNAAQGDAAAALASVASVAAELRKRGL